MTSRLWTVIFGVVLGAVLIWGMTMMIHSAHAQEEGQQRMPPRADQLKVEWVIFAIVSKDHHPTTAPSEYQLETFPTAVACLARLAKPDTRLAATRKGFDAAVQAKIPGAISEWSCGAQMTPILGQAV